MIRSMTGYGMAEMSDEQFRIAAEIRTLNNRFLKLNQRLPEGMMGLEVPIEKLVRQHLSRGTVNVNLTVEPRGEAARAPINVQVLAGYARDLAAARQALGGAAGPVPLEALLALPGVVGETAGPGAGAHPAAPGAAEGLRARVEKVVAQALERLDAMRAAEGEAIARDMAGTLDGLQAGLASVQEQAPKVVQEYRDRLRERVEELLADVEIAADDQALARELAFFAERSDVNEEVARLASHLAQFRELLVTPGPSGRKLEFLTQEMHREVNTMGAKANDAAIVRDVLEMKLGVDRLREHSHNIE